MSPGGQPTTSLQVLLVTPKLGAYLRRQPPGIVVVDAALHPLRRPAQVPSLRTDLRITKNVPCLNGHEPLAGPSAVRRFRAVTAVLCEGGQRVYPGRGQWEVYLRKVAVSSVANFQRYFEQHSVSTHPGTACTADLRGVITPIFVDSGGHWLVPKTPLDGCHHPLGFAGPGSLRVRWHVVHARKTKQLISAPALAAGCAMGWGRSGPVRLPAGPIFGGEPRTVRICIYRTSQRHQWAGDFVRGFRLDRAQTARLLSAMNGAAPRPHCPREFAFAEVIASPGRAVNVELGGCYRVDGTRTANHAVVRAILGRG